MKLRTQKLLTTMAVAGYMFGSIGTAMAASSDDTEIFFGNDPGSQLRPNVLFIFDTSGSMKDAPNLQASEDRKIEIARDALRVVLDQVSYLNIGLARFNGNPGGPILLPVKNVDETAIPKIISRVAASNGDAVRTGVSSANLTNSKLTLPSAAGRVGFRFADIDIPQGAKITRAAIGLTSTSGDSSGSVTLSISAQAGADTPVFTTSDGPRLLSGAANTIGTPVSWVAPSMGTQGQNFTTPELAPLIQSVINQSGWVGGNAITLFIDKISGTGYRTVYSWDGINAHSDMVKTSASNYPSTPLLAPTLYIEWTDSEFPGAVTKHYRKTVVSKVREHSDDIEERLDGSIELVPGPYLEPKFNNHAAVGVRFNTVRVPKTATISSAYLKMRSGNISDGGGTASYKVTGVKEANFPGFTNDPTPVTGLPATTASVNWSPASFTAVNQAAQVDVTSVVQELVNQTDWSLGNAMAFAVKHTGGTRNDYFSSVENNSNGWLLEVTFVGSYASGAYTHRDVMKAGAEDFIPLGSTPISDLMAEAGRYFQGATVDHGNKRGTGGNYERPGMRVSGADTLASGSLSGCTSVNPNDYGCRNEVISAGAKYKSPIMEQCEANYIVFMTDGLPTAHNTSTATYYNTLSGTTCSSHNCAIKLAGWYANEDMGPSGLLEKQTVKTHVIAFGLNVSFLQDLATAGKGVYKTAYSADELVAAFEAITASIEKRGTSFVSAGLTVNQGNRLTHSDQLYFALFAPDKSQRWPGNLKRYRLYGGNVVDADNDVAVTPSGYFADDAKSFWSAVTDGGSVPAGGAASKLTSTRAVYSDVSASADLTAISNRVTDSNSNITQAMLAAESASERTKVLQWARGQDVDDQDDDGNVTEPNNIVGDPLHSQPTLVTYKVSGVQKTIVYFGTNNGYLHAVDSEDGTEKWAYVPRPLLSHLRTSRANGGTTVRQYGLDGSPTVYQDDVNRNGVIEPEAGESAYLIVGERRGGNRYYALDVSNWTQPKMMYTITGGTGDYAKLGQSWATPAIAQIKIGGVVKTGVFLGGGYDPIQDEWGAPQTSTKGNVVYIADVRTGAKLWSSDEAVQAPVAGPLSSMSSVPSELALLDLDGDGLVERFYAVDTKAQVFRFDVVGSDIRGGRLASLQDGVTEANNRRFYYSPSVAVSSSRTGKPYLAVAVGSGFREHPKDLEVNEHFYTLRDYGATEFKFEKDIKLSDLVNVTDIVGDANSDGELDAVVAIESANQHGWYLDFDDPGEKVLASPVIFNNKVYFTSYLPTENASESCSSSTIGYTRLYVVNLSDGNPVRDYNLDEQMQKEERYKDATEGIAPVTLVATEQGVQVLVGAETDGPPERSGVSNIFRTRWWRATQ